MQRMHFGISSLIVLLCACSSNVPPLPTATPLPLPTAISRPTETAMPTHVVVAPTARPSPTIIHTETPAVSPVPMLPADLILVGATLIDGTGTAPLLDAVLAIRDGHVVGVGPAGSVAIDPAAQLIDMRGKTILPGLINAHAHTVSLSDDELREFTRAGVTTVRDLAGPLDLLVRRAERFAEAADPSLPRVRIAGPMLTVPGGHPISIYGVSDESVAVNSPIEARIVTERLLDAGVQHIKIAVSGRTDVNWPELSDDQIRAITDVAHVHGARVTAHIDRASALQRAVLAGLDDAGHMPRDRMSDELIALMVSRGVSLVPTIDVYENLAEERGNGAAWRASTLPVMEDNLRRFVAAGGNLALGDDYGNPGVALGLPYDEMQKWIGAGLTPMQVLVAATQGSARVCGIDQELGTLAPGKIADLLVVDGNPLADLGILRQVVLVVRSGQVAYRR